MSGREKGEAFDRDYAIERVGLLLATINTNAANSVSGFGSKANRKLIFDLSQEAEELFYLIRTSESAP